MDLRRQQNCYSLLKNQDRNRKGKEIIKKTIPMQKNSDNKYHDLIYAGAKLVGDRIGIYLDSLRAILKKVLNWKTPSNDSIDGF